MSSRKHAINGFRRALATDSTQAAGTLSEGFQATPTGVLAPIALNQAMSCEIVFCGKPAATTTRTFNIWRWVPVSGNDNQGTGYGILTCLGSGTATFGTTTGVSGKVVDSTEQFASTISYTKASTTTTPKGPSSDMEAALGDYTPKDYSPGTSGIASLFIGSLGRGGALVVEFTGGTSSLATNVLVQTRDI